MSRFDDWLRALGFNPVQLRWRWHRLRERAQRARRRGKNRLRSLTYRHKVCRGCSLTVDRAAARCPRCGGRLPGPWRDRLQRGARVLVPGEAYTYTGVLVALNVAFYLAMWLRSGGGPSALGQPVDPAVIYRFGGWRAPAVVDGELWRLVTAIFLHFDLMHLIFNCIWLVHLGSLVEQFLGRPRYLALYLGSGITGFAVTVLAHLGAGPHVGAGASGVVFGLIGCALVLGYGRRGPAAAQGHQGRRPHLPGTEAFRAGLLKWAIFATVISLLSGADHFAHFGGAAAGALMGLGLTPEGQPGRRGRPLWIGIELGLLAILVLSIGFAWAFVPNGVSG